MLVLCRKKDEKIVIGEGQNAIVLTVVEVIGNKVRIGVEADKHIPVHRFEVYQEIHKGENGSNKNLSSM